ncbi:MULTISPECIES: DsbA family protein [Rummeliibacillus]|uniref:DsbA family protein n=1 Tax=Rummeliibacillus TaxID=648802 RepID=UPI0011B56A39|nr:MULTISPECIES: DsbA family protein [Rummeliibacillus]MBO2534338.1 DsbA family protein [Rummeliibacillus suwonensis]
MNNIYYLAEKPAVSSTTALSKPIELYVFMDLLSPSSWELQSLIRQLQVNYGQYFSLRIILSTELNSLNTACQRIHSCESSEELVDVSHPVLPSIAVKAAELQGKKAGYRYLMKLQEYALLKTKNVCQCNILQEIAQEIDLDIEEFQSDFLSMEATRAFQSDLCITREMEIDEVPCFVFFNENIEDEGLKVCGSYSYEVYEKILEELLDEKLVCQQPPSVEELFHRYHILTTKEVAAIYHISLNAAERELKKKMLQQKLDRVICDELSLWRLK